MPGPSRAPRRAALLSHPTPCFRLLLCCATLLALTASPAAAATIFVTESGDSVPPVEGTLRWAVDLSNGNGEADVIEVLIDIDKIVLVAPLPTLVEGRLTFGPRPGITEPGPGGTFLTLDGDGLVGRAWTVSSARNRIGGLRFTGFTGPEMVLLRGSAAETNVIAGCEFIGSSDGTATPTAGVRILADNTVPGIGQDNVVRHSRFDGLTNGVVVDGSPAPSAANLARPVASVFRNWFGLDPLGEPSNAGVDRPVEVTDAGPVHVQKNRIAGAIDGIVMDNANGSHVHGNEIGIFGNLSLNCSGAAGTGIHITASNDVTVRDNRVFCSGVGVSLNGAERPFVERNALGSTRPGTGNLSHGLEIDGGSDGTVRDNRIDGNGGFGISIVAPTVPGGVLSCNTMVENSGLPISAPGVTTTTPILSQTNGVRVLGSQVDAAPGHVEIFGGEGTGPSVYQGTTRLGDDAVDFSHPLPVLGLSLNKTAIDPTQTAVSFATADPLQHVGTATSDARHETSELSAGLSSENAGLVFDLVRGDLAALASGAVGGVDLGAVTCLASGVTGADLPVFDDVDPLPGEGFFYVSRRRLSEANQSGTYDPAVCGTDARSFTGPRRPSSGDCVPGAGN